MNCCVFSFFIYSEQLRASTLCRYSSPELTNLWTVSLMLRFVNSYINKELPAIS